MKLYIINPSCTLFKTQDTKQQKPKKGRPKMAIRRKKRSKASYKKAARKAVRTRRRRVARRKNPAKRRKVFSFAKAPKRSYRAKRRVNPKKKRRAMRRRRNPINVKALSKKIFSKDAMMNAVLLLVGIGGAGSLKSMTSKFMPEGALKTWYQRLFGAVSISLGYVLATKSKRKETKVVSNGLIAFGVYDLLVSNVPALQSYLPAISAPSAFSGYRQYGRSTYSGMMGAGINQGRTEVVGSNISYNSLPEIVGNDEPDLADMLDMAC